MRAQASAKALRGASGVVKPLPGHGGITNGAMPRASIPFLFPSLEESRPMTCLRAKVAVCLLALAAVAALTPPAAADDPKYYPAATEFVVSVNFRQMLESDLVKGKKETVDKLKLLWSASLQQNKELGKYLKELAFDPERDLDGFALVGPASPDLATRFLVLIDGRFDAKKFDATAERVARDHGDVLKITKAGKHLILAFSPPREEQTIYVALANEKLLLASPSKAMLTDALTQGAGEKEAELKQQVKDLLASRGKKTAVSFVATSAAIDQLLAATKDPQIAKAAPTMKLFLRQVNGVSASATFGTDIEFQLGVFTKDANAAKQLAAQATLLLAFANVALTKEAQNNPQAAQLMDIVKTMQASAQGSTFTLRGQVPAAVADQALKNLLNKR
jgi:hypothetical protein